MYIIFLTKKNSTREKKLHFSADGGRTLPPSELLKASQFLKLCVFVKMFRDFV